MNHTDRIDMLRAEVQLWVSKHNKNHWKWNKEERAEIAKLRDLVQKEHRHIFRQIEEGNIKIITGGNVSKTAPNPYTTEVVRKKSKATKRKALKARKRNRGRRGKKI